MRGGWAVPAVLWGIGIVLVVAAAGEGGAHLALVLIVPVVYGSSLLFGLGVLFLILGFLSLPFLALPAPGPEEPIPPASTPSAGGAGGLVLVGPVPIFFGSWKNVSRRARILVAIAGGVALAVLVLLWVVFRG